VNLTATANTGFAFSSWTGSVANANSASTTVTMSAPKSVTANFTPSGPTTTSLVLSGPDHGELFRHHELRNQFGFGDSGRAMRLGDATEAALAKGPLASA